MFVSFLITFRETLEIILVIVLILGYLIRTRQQKYNHIVYLGVISGSLVSILAGVLFSNINFVFDDFISSILKTLLVFLAAALVTSLAFFILKQKQIAENIRQKVQLQLDTAGKFGLFLLVFITVLREGVEMVLFLGLASFVNFNVSFLLGAFLGVFSAILLGFSFFAGSIRVNSPAFFGVAFVLLILFAGGLIAHGIENVQNSGVISFFNEPVWDVNPDISQNEDYPVMHEKGVVGGTANALFEYDSNPSFLKVLAYAFYLSLVFAGFYKIRSFK